MWLFIILEFPMTPITTTNKDGSCFFMKPFSKEKKSNEERILNHGYFIKLNIAIENFSNQYD